MPTRIILEEKCHSNISSLLTNLAESGILSILDHILSINPFIHFRQLYSELENDWYDSCLILS